MRRFQAAERGAVRYPRYEMSRSRSAFGSRQELLAYEAALQQAAAVDDCLQVCLFLTLFSVR